LLFALNKAGSGFPLIPGKENIEQDVDKPNIKI